MKTFTKEDLISRLEEISAMGWIENKRDGNHGGIGNTLEDLVGIEENNLPIPNASEWELKTQRLGTSSLTTLFHTEPSPTALKFVPNVLLLKYGWPHKEAGTRYPETELSFRQTIHGLARSDRGFMVQVNRKEKKILISFDSKSVSKRHEIWLKSVEKKIGLSELNPQPYWGFEDLEHKLGAKLNNCFFVQASVKRTEGKEFYKYDHAMMLMGLDFEGFLRCLEAGIILVDFDARTGHNHGTKFRIRQNNWPALYREKVTLF
ncbi:MAG TPA: MvaI/BcnI family restriction endonuclease [Candidatus Saccharimonadales bacterium]|nr:MvaI/BcnI family restriction endonuclease [Candidatus Saccharimonadales bacterium]